MLLSRTTPPLLTYPCLTLMVWQCRVFEVTDEAGVTGKRTKKKENMSAFILWEQNEIWGKCSHSSSHLPSLCQIHYSTAMHISFHILICHHHTHELQAVCVQISPPSFIRSKQKSLYVLDRHVMYCSVQNGSGYWEMLLAYECYNTCWRTLFEKNKERLCVIYNSSFFQL